MAPPPSQVHRFTRSYIVESQALTPAGDAKESLSAILAGKHCLKLSQEWGWLGEINDVQNLRELALHVASPCWQRGQQIHPLPVNSELTHEWPGIAITVSKGNTAAWLHENRASERYIPDGIPGMLSQVCARSWNQRFFHGYPVVGACASGLLTLIEGARMVEAGTCPWAWDSTI